MIALTLSTMTIAQWAILIIVAAGIIAVVMVILRQIGVAVPPFIINILWICLAVVIGVVAVRFLMGVLV